VLTEFLGDRLEPSLTSRKTGKRNRPTFQLQEGHPLWYGDIEVEVRYRTDMLVADCVIIENKSVHEMPAIYEAQLLTYLKLSRHRIGFLVNWSVILIKDGIKRMVNRL
jgi:GxxExxY protein